jgi:hypothetical protein
MSMVETESRRMAAFFPPMSLRESEMAIPSWVRSEGLLVNLTPRAPAGISPTAYRVMASMNHPGEVDPVLLVRLLQDGEGLVRGHDDDHVPPREQALDEGPCVLPQPPG